MRTIWNSTLASRRASTALGALGLLVMALGSGGCADDAPNPGGSGGGGAGRPAFVVGTRVWDDTATTAYFHAVPSLDRGTEVDLSEALEVPGSAKLYGFEDLGWLAIGGGDAPTISRYTLDERGALEEGTSVNLQPLGVQDLWPTLYFVSPTKAYYPDRHNEQLIVLNPAAMKVEGTIELPETARQGYLALYSYGSILRGDSLLFSVGWFDWEQNDTILEETGLVVIDTTTDTLVRVDVDERCGGITQPVETASGDAYFVSSALAGAAHRLDRLPTEPCALRVQKGADAFDKDYLMALGELTDGAIAGEPIPGGGDSVFLRVFDEGAATIEADSVTWDLTSQKVWQWWRWDTATGEAARIDELSPMTSDVLWFQVDGRVFGTETADDYAESTLIELTAEGGPKRAMTVPGFLHGVSKVR
ncbi:MULTISPECIES: hypothetical protein [Sorangium]|uniref:Secreted protein n=1 Tax=Sorangium cellulosum TaxID=56 RepID=A0A4P2R4P2_SORCE|nr:MULTISPECIES: hypothetical protein [Sorangium]AUX37718.1 hypothetical protein SOCE836_099480 [Sorangium cellulosum]WCQ97005.1 hypothetical protein NQZ70_09795 [Sorangium sp. Soce836]